MNLKDNFHKCTKCDNLTAKVNYTSDSDGASWTWITWHHNCQNKDCNYQEEKKVQTCYDYEDVENCGICGIKYIRNKQP